jgi:hypothetical protein
MKTIVWKANAVLAALTWLAVTLPGVAQEEGVPVDRVLVKDGKVVAVQAGKTVELEKEIALPGEIKVMTNAVFTVRGGRERPLKEGQVLGADGMLTSPDGSVVPVFDHLAMKNGRPLLTRDGDTAALAAETALGDGSRVTPDGFHLHKDGRRLRLLDGQLLRLDGSAIAARDTVMFKDGQVIVQKDGSLLRVTRGTSLMMNDGTKVFGDGTLVTRDGTKKALVEGEILPLEGVVVHRK